MSQKNWDKYEVALLIEAYQNIKQGRVDRNTALVALSQSLRQMAINEGLKIDETYRNLNGMQWQSGIIEGAFLQKDYDKCTPPKIFIEMVDLYIGDQPAFRAVLQQAHNIVSLKVNMTEEDRCKDFIDWLKEKDKIIVESVIQNINFISEYAIKHGLIKKSIWATIAVKEFNILRAKISGNKFFKMMHKQEHASFEKNGKLYADYLKEHAEKIVVIKQAIAELSLDADSPHQEDEVDNDLLTKNTSPVATEIGVTAMPMEQVLDLNNIPDLSFTKPIYATFNGIELDVYNWKMVYISVLHILYRVYSVKLNNYIGKSFGCGTRIDLSYNSVDLIAPKLISSEHSVYAESNLSAYDIAKRMATVLKICGVSYDRLVIKYFKKPLSSDDLKTSMPTVSTTERQVQSHERNKAIDADEPFLIWMLQNTKLSEHTARGYVSSLITLSRWASEKGLIKGSLLNITDANEFTAAEKEIRSNSDFIILNENGHNRFSAALSRYGQYLGIEARDEASVGTSEKREAKASPGRKKRDGRGVPIESAVDLLKRKGLTGATVQEIVDEIQPGAAISSTRMSLEASSDIIAMPRDRYIHRDAFVDLDEAKDTLSHILAVHFSEFDGYSNNKLLYGAASHDLSMFLNDNDCDDIDCVYALARYFFDRQKNIEGYTFANPHIFEYAPDHTLNLRGLMVHHARHNGGILVEEEAESYLQRTLLSYGGMGQVLGISNADTFLIYNSQSYILSEILGAKADLITSLRASLNNLFKQENVLYIIPRDINEAWLQSLPALPHGLPWTLLLLQEVIKKLPEIGFRTITSGLTQSYDTIAAAFAVNDSPFQFFADVVSAYISEKYSVPKRMSYEELRQILLECGMIAGNELIYALPQALDDYRFSWTDENRTVLVRSI